MGGVGSGGARPGSGRKPRTAIEREVTATRDRGPVRVLPHPSSGQTPVDTPTEETEIPDYLTPEERQVWMSLAPHAAAAGTLLPQTAFAFGVLCRNVVSERDLASDGQTRLGSAHLKMIHTIDNELLRFNLSPCGKPIFKQVKKAEPVNPLDRFIARKRG